MDSVKGKVVLVTGGVGGIGSAVTQILLKNGAKVCIADVNAEKGAEVAKAFGQDIIFVKCDVTSDEDYDNAFRKTKEAFGGLDIVFNNAGVLGDAQWRKSIEVNLTAIIRGTMLAVEHMGVDKGGKGGIIVNTASITGLVDLVPILPVYAATRHGVVAFTRSMAENTWLTDKGLRLNCICPYLTDTPFLQAFNDERQFYGGQDAIDKCNKQFGPPMQVSRVAEAFLKLVQDSSLNGAAMIVKESGTEIHEPRK